MTHHRLSNQLEQKFLAVLSDFDEHCVNFRLWAKDKSLFTSTTEADFLDWLNEPERLARTLPSLYAIRDELVARNFSSVVLLGMGGSSLSPMVFQSLFGSNIPFFVVDTIHPSALKRLLNEIDVPTTLFIIASKSGTTLEPLLLYRFFVNKLRERNIVDPYAHFVAITDPITALEQEASENGFLRGPFGEPGIGGRFSGLSVFGILPALLMGIDGEQLLDRARSMARDCGPSVPAHDNPSSRLAAFFAAALSSGRDKIVFHLTPMLVKLGFWLEQLLAESLGKQGHGLVPLIGQHDTIDQSTTMHVVIGENITVMRDAPHDVPVYFIESKDRFDIAGLMFLFQMATALFASTQKINPFDQPDVEESKKCTRAILKKLETGEAILPSSPTHFFGDNAVYGSAPDFFRACKLGDYCAILAFVDETEGNMAELTKLKDAIERKTAIPVMLEIGPRFLHSTGQLFKGGKNNGHFLVVTGQYADDFSSGGSNNLMFSQIHLGQALGDIDALKQAGRRVLHLHSGTHTTDFKQFMAFIESL